MTITSDKSGTELIKGANAHSSDGVNGQSREGCFLVRPVRSPEAIAEWQGSGYPFLRELLVDTRLTVGLC
jgi:hypothetical protein